MRKLAGLLGGLLLLPALAGAEEIGEVSTVFKWVGPNDKIVVEAFDDPKVQGVTCYLSRAKTGGVKGGLGLAEDRAEASIACRQVGPIQFSGELKDGEEVFKQRTSLVFKSMQVVRFFDRKRNALVYLVYSDRVIEGSPQNAVTAIPLMPWPTARFSERVAGNKKPAIGRFFIRARRALGGSGAEGLDVAAQTALVTSSLVLVDDAFVSHAVDHRYSGGEGGLGFFQVLGVDGFHDVLDVGAHHGAQAGVVAATLLSLFGAFFGGRCVGHRRAPRKKLGK